jgi:hypothetical protein
MVHDHCGKQAGFSFKLIREVAQHQMAAETKQVVETYNDKTKDGVINARWWKMQSG